MKNFFGVVPGIVYGWPKNVLHMAESRIRSSISPRRSGRSSRSSTGSSAWKATGQSWVTPACWGIVMGSDVVAVDATCARVMGLDPRRIGYLAEAGRFLGNLAEGAIEMRGEPLARFASSFALPPSLTGGTAG